MDLTMVRKKHKPDEIIKKLRDADVMLADGRSIAEVARQLEVSEQTYHRWRNQFGGMKGPEMKRLKELEKENASLKRIVAAQALDNQALKDIAEGNF
jgi:putative transposase